MGQMMRTALRIYRGPRDVPLSPPEPDSIECPWAVEAYLSWMKGEPRTHIHTSHYYQDYLTPSEKIMVDSYRAKMGYRDEDGGTLTLQCNDGPFTCDKTFARTTFAFIDDILSEFPDSPVAVPFDSGVVIDCLGLSKKPSLLSSLAALKFLNPKDSSYYFRFDTSGVKPVTLLELAHNLTETNRIHILEAWRYEEANYSLPKEGLGYGILAPILIHHGDFENLEAIFHDYPSFLLSAFLYRAATLGQRDALIHEPVRHYLLTKSFETEELLPSNKSRAGITEAIVRALSETKEKQEALRMLSMIGMHSEIFGLDEERQRVRAPYGIECTHHIEYYCGKRSRFCYRENIIENLSSIFSLEPDDVERTFDRLVKELHSSVTED